MKAWRVHACILDADCRDYDLPRRLHVFTPWGQLILACGRKSWTQAWLPLFGYQRWWAPVVWHPSDGKRSRWQRELWPERHRYPCHADDCMTCRTIRKQ